MAFFGFMLANLTYLIVKDYRHKLLFIVTILIGFISLTLGQALIERVFALEIRISMIIESVGGFLFFILLYRRARRWNWKTLTNPFKNRIFCKTFRLKSVLRNWQPSLVQMVLENRLFFPDVYKRQVLVFSLLDRLSELSWEPTSEPPLLPLSSVSNLASTLYPWFSLEPCSSSLQKTEQQTISGAYCLV